MAVSKINMTVNLRHAGYVVAIPAKTGFPFQIGEVLTELSDHPVRIGQVSQVHRQVVEIIRGRLLVKAFNILRQCLFQMQRPMIFHGNGKDKQWLFGMVHQLIDFFSDRRIANIGTGLLAVLKRLDIDEFLKPHVRKHLVTAEKFRRIGMDADGMVAKPG